MNRPERLDMAPPPVARSVNWPDLVAKAERRGVPVLRVDEHGDTRLIRTTRQLLEEWD